jgi:hypothetical protein
MTSVNAKELTLPALLAEWTEPDETLYYLACLLGIMYYEDTPEAWQTVKGTLNTNNVVSRVLFDMIDAARAGGMLLVNEDNQYRWNSDFAGNSRLFLALPTQRSD